MWILEWLFGEPVTIEWITVTLPLTATGAKVLLASAGLALGAGLVWLMLNAPDRGDKRRNLLTDWLTALGWVLLPVWFLLLGGTLWHLWLLFSGMDSFLDNVGFGMGAVVAAFLGGPFVIWGTVLKQQTVEFQKEGHITDRISKAVEQLGAEKTVKRDGKPEETVRNIEVRIGGLLSLERIAQDSTRYDKGRDHVRVMEILCAYVRENAPAEDAVDFPLMDWEPLKDDASEEERAAHLTWQKVRFGIFDNPNARQWAQSLPEPRADIAMALRIIGRRDADQLRVEARWGPDSSDDVEWVFDEDCPELPEPPEGNRHGKAALDTYKAVLSAWKEKLSDYRGFRPDLRNTNLQKADLSKQTLSGANLIGARMEGADLTQARMEGAILSEAWVEGAILSEARMGGAILIEARMEGAILSEARMQGADLMQARMEGADLSKARMEGAYLGLARMEGAVLTQARMEGAYLETARMEGAYLEAAWMEGAVLTQARMEGAYLETARMEGAYLEAAWMEGADLTLAWMEGAFLELARMEDANLMGARMEGAVLRQARMEGAILSGARMAGAFLGEARMEGADLMEARMEGAILIMARMEGANLRGARMEGADLRGARMEGAILSEARMEGADLQWARVDATTSLTNAVVASASVRSVDYSNVALSQAQINGMFGDASVILPEDRQKPGFWPKWELPLKGKNNFNDEWREWQSDPDNYTPPPPPE
ncbi:secreted effector protein PipB2 [Antarctobacter heliothermus]|uniref:Secreted effector protein PipB2 n=1 Tax=Antarctobacter heliothermus TaxID=74033 RepID=A0A222E8T6_9RHOB|nr:pentapeptide repeat-containing protein [Antarctobacter heliothermus]ASP22619.1 secreted effector protein PipB2 [Antarctobacter heliothermus]